MGRRAYLATVGAGIAGLGGCVGVPGTDGSREANAELFEQLAADEPAYRRWLPAEALDPHVVWWAGNVTRVLDRQSALSTELLYRYLGIGNWHAGFGWDRLAGSLVRLTEVGPVVYTPGEFLSPAADSTIGNAGWTWLDETDDFRRYRRSRLPGVQGSVPHLLVDQYGMVKIPNGNEASIAVARRMLRTAAGSHLRLTDRSDAFGFFSQTVGWPLVVMSAYNEMLWAFNLGPEGPPGRHVIGWRADHLLDGQLCERFWLVPRPNSGVTTADILAGVRSEHPEFRSPGGDVALRSDRDRVEVVRIEPIGDPGGQLPPQFNVGMSVVDDGVLVRHFAGNPISLSRLSVVARGDSFQFGTGQLGPGEELRLDVDYSPGVTVQLIYTVTTPDLSARIASVEVSE